MRQADERPDEASPGNPAAGLAAGGPPAAGGGSARLPFKPHRAILEAEIAQARQELQRPLHGLLVSGILAGFAVGTSLFLMAVVLTMAEGALPPAVVGLLVANAFTIGFVIVVLSRIDLFTEYTTIAILPVLTGDATLGGLMRLWGPVYVGNVVGIAAFSAFLVALGPALEVIEPAAFGRLADPMTAHGPLVTASSGLLAGWLMGVLSWLVAAARDTVSQILVVWALTFTIGLGQLHHSITGAGEVISGLLAQQGPGPEALASFMVWTTAGNALGGVLFAVLIRYSLVLRDGEREEGGRGEGADERRRRGARRAEPEDGGASESRGSRA